LSDYQKTEGGETGGGGPEAIIVDIAAKVENDWRNPCLGSWGDDQTVLPTLNKDLKLSQKSVR
jgi:hypothetical protein